MGSPTNDHDSGPKSQSPVSPSELQKSSQGVRHAVAAPLKSVIAQRRTIQYFQGKLHQDCSPAKNGGPSSTHETEWTMVSRSTLLNSKQRVGVLVVSEAQQGPYGLVSRFPTPNSRRRSSLPGQLSSGGDPSKDSYLKEQFCVSSQPGDPSRLPELPGSAPRM